MRLPPAPDRYDRQALQEAFNEIEQVAENSQQNDQDVDIGPARRLVLTSPDGSRWSITVDNTGTLTATAI